MLCAYWLPNWSQTNRLKPMDTESQSMPETARSNIPQRDEPKTFTAFCPKCQKAFTKDTPESVSSALRMHIQRAHNHMTTFRKTPAKERANRNPNHPVNLGRLSVKRYGMEERIQIVKDWIASGEMATEYSKLVKLHPWTLRDWRDRYHVTLNGQTNTRKVRSNPRKAGLISAKNRAQLRRGEASSTPAAPEAPAFKLPNFCPECGFNLATFLMAYSVAKAR